MREDRLQHALSERSSKQRSPAYDPHKDLSTVLRICADLHTKMVHTVQSTHKAFPGASYSSVFLKQRKNLCILCAFVVFFTFNSSQPERPTTAPSYLHSPTERRNHPVK